jgi:hypothetical protein
MIHRIVVQQLGTRCRQAQVAPHFKQITLTSSGPDDALNDLPAVRVAEHEVRSSVQAGLRQFIRDVLELVEAHPHAGDFIGAEQRSPSDPADLEVFVNFIGAQTDVEGCLPHVVGSGNDFLFVPA